jgi:hypothetical protein
MVTITGPVVFLVNASPTPRPLTHIRRRTLILYFPCPYAIIERVGCVHAAITL